MTRIHFWAFLNSVGTLTLWLLMGPYYNKVEASLVSFGILAFHRQIFSLVGSLVGGVFADTGNSLKKHFNMELLVFCVTGMLFYIDWQYDISKDPIVLQVWAILRFFFASMSFVFFYRYLSSIDFNEKGNASIVQLFLTQGASILAPVIAILIAFNFSNVFQVALYFDLFTSSVYSLILWSKLSSQENLSEEIKEGPALIKRIQNNFSILFQKSFFPYNFIQIIFLFATMGFYSQVMDLSISQSWLPQSIFFPLATITYGASLWVTGPIVKSSKSPNAHILWGACGYLLSGLLLLNSGDVHSLKLVSFLLYSFFLWLLLHATNKAILDRCPNEFVGSLRASMVFYLSIIFAIGEVLIGYLAEHSLQVGFISYSRIICSIVIMFLLVAYKPREI